ncbi:MAG TPA: hypothetical protein DCW29_16970 [Janthinobacterium sp.]|nr:hypothetical protein [Janthinobacterium sp.]
MRAFIIAVCIFALGGCNVVDTLREGFTHSRAVSAKLETTLGLKSFVGFNSMSGTLTSVTVTFDGLPEKASLLEISAASRQAMLSELKQVPQKIVISFAADA